MSCRVKVLKLIVVEFAEKFIHLRSNCISGRIRVNFARGGNLRVHDSEDVKDVFESEFTDDGTTNFNDLKLFVVLMAADGIADGSMLYQVLYGLEGRLLCYNEVSVEMVMMAGYLLDYPDHDRHKLFLLVLLTGHHFFIF